jgi:hypothetical protein
MFQVGFAVFADWRLLDFSQRLDLERGGCAQHPNLCDIIRNVFGLKKELRK